MSHLRLTTKIVQKSAKRLGRGVGSGKGEHTVGRGTKGQRARKSGQAAAYFEGGNLPMTKRLPMQRGKGKFKSLTPTALVTLDDLQNMAATTITLDALKLEHIIEQRFSRAKIVANGKISRAVTIQGIPLSQTAATMVQQAGGSIASATS